MPQYGGRLFCAHYGHRGPSPFRHGGRWCLVLTTEHDQHASGGTAAWGRSTPWQAMGPCTRGASWPPAVPCKPGLFQLHGRRCAVRTSSMASMRSARRGRAVVLVWQAALPRLRPQGAASRKLGRSSFRPSAHRNWSVSRCCDRAGNCRLSCAPEVGLRGHRRAAAGGTSRAPVGGLFGTRWLLVTRTAITVTGAAYGLVSFWFGARPRGRRGQRPCRGTVGGRSAGLGLRWP